MKEQGVGVMEEEGGTGVKEKRGAGVEAHAEDTEEGAQWRADVEEGVRWRADAEEEQAPTGVGK
jgi:hypothetical protein